MKKVFLDTNVLLDFILNREGAENTSKIFQIGRDGDIELYVSVLTMANAAYIGKRGRTKENLLEFLNLITSFVNVLSMDEVQWKNSISIDSPDLEDMLQYQCALAGQCDIVITRNVKHFTFSKIQVLTPTEFLDSL